MAMTSLGAAAGKKLHMDITVNDGHGPWVYKVQGAMHHFIGSLLPTGNTTPCFAQLYFYEPATALENRLRHHQQLHRDVLQEVQSTIYEHHPFVPLYHSALELTAHMAEDTHCKIALRYIPGTHHGRYNLPTVSDEISVIVPGPDEVACDP